MEQQESVFVYIEITKEFLFTDSMRHTYVKLSYPELQACFMLFYILTTLVYLHTRILRYTQGSLFS